MGLDPWDWEARPAWHADAACRGVDQAVFYPERGESLDEARALCAVCPVQGACLDQGLREKHGVWGGASERERRRMRRRLKVTAIDEPEGLSA